MDIVNTSRAKAKLSRLIAHARTVVAARITSCGALLVRFVSIRLGMQPRQPGALKGKIWVADDFDAPDPEIEQMFYGKEP
jgi:hypothetical protein